MVEHLQLGRRLSARVRREEVAEDGGGQTDGAVKVVGAVRSEVGDHHGVDLDYDEDDKAGLARRDAGSKALHLRMEHLHAKVTKIITSSSNHPNM